MAQKSAATPITAATYHPHSGSATVCTCRAGTPQEVSNCSVAAHQGLGARIEPCQQLQHTSKAFADQPGASAVIEAALADMLGEIRNVRIISSCIMSPHRDAGHRGDLPALWLRKLQLGALQDCVG